jgi:hypothetical protein
MNIGPFERTDRVDKAAAGLHAQPPTGEWGHATEKKLIKKGLGLINLLANEIDIADTVFENSVRAVMHGNLQPSSVQSEGLIDLEALAPGTLLLIDREEAFQDSYEKTSGVISADHRYPSAVSNFLHCEPESLINQASNKFPGSSPIYRPGVVQTTYDANWLYRREAWFGIVIPSKNQRRIYSLNQTTRYETTDSINLKTYPLSQQLHFPYEAGVLSVVDKEGSGGPHYQQIREIKAYDCTDFLKVTIEDFKAHHKIGRYLLRNY